MTRKKIFLCCIFLITGCRMSIAQHPVKAGSDSGMRDITFITDPPNAEIRVDSILIGLSNNTISILAGKHTILISKAGFATVKINLEAGDNGQATSQIYRKLRKNYPFDILNEGEKTYSLGIKGRDSLSEIFFGNDNRFTGQAQLLPYGKYRFTLRDGKRVVYRGRHTHSPFLKPAIKLPVYSPTSFKTLAVDYINPGNIEVSFGQSQFLAGTGLSSSFLNFHYLGEDFIRTEGNVPDGAAVTDMLLPDMFLLNWDFRLGGSILRFMDICALARFKFSPGIKFLGVNINGLNDPMALAYFYGIECSTRLPYFNLNVKAGRQIISGEFFTYDQATKDYCKAGIPFGIDKPVVSFGLVINGPIEKTNNMFRIWKRPLDFGIFRKIDKPSGTR